QSLVGAFRNAGPHQDLADENEEGNGDQEEGRAGGPEDLPHGPIEREEGVGLLEHKAQDHHGRRHGDREQEQEQQDDQGGRDHASLSWYSLISSSSVRLPASSCIRPKSLARSATRIRSQSRSVTMANQARPLHQRTCGIQRGVASGVLAVELRAMEVE